MLVKEVMRGEVSSISLLARLEDAAKVFAERNEQYLIVMDNTEIKGLLSTADLVGLTEEERNQLNVKDRMTKTVECISPETEIEKAAQQIEQYRLECLPVCQNEKLIGLITLQELREATQRRKKSIN